MIAWATPTRSRKSRWRNKLRHFSSLATAFRSRDSVSPSSSNLVNSSPFTPPQSSSYASDVASLTPLDVHDAESACYVPLTARPALMLGELTLPPPPPPKPGRNRLYSDQSPLQRQRPWFDDNEDAALCFICSERLDATLEHEQWIPLACGDGVHEECLRTVVEYEVRRKTREGKLSQHSTRYEIEREIVPVCRGRLCSAKAGAALEDPIEPHNVDVVDQLVADARLSLKLSGANASLSDSSALQRSPTTAFSSLPFGGPLEAPEILASVESSANNSYCPKNAIMGDFEPQKIHSAGVLLHHPAASASVKYNIRMLVASVALRAVSRIQTPNYLYSSALRNLTLLGHRTSLPVSIFSLGGRHEHATIPLEQLQSIFIKNIIGDPPAMDLALVVALGPLRLVDVLEVRMRNPRDDDIRRPQFSCQTVYLFSNYLVISAGADREVYSLDDIEDITAPTTAELELIFQHSRTVTLRSASTAAHVDGRVLEKWSIAFSDALLEFPPEIFTLTLSVADSWKHKPEISPIAEQSPVSPASWTLSCETQLLYGECVNDESDRLTSPFLAELSKPVSPLRIHREDDWDSDSDDEAIKHALETRQRQTVEASW